MIIIVEGIDRVGKTTFCNIMKNRYGARIFKGKSYDDEELKDISREDLYGIQELGSLESIADSKELIVMDRFHWTEKVYGKVLRGYDSKYTNIIEKEIIEINNSKRNQIIILLVRPTDIERSSKEHGLDLQDYQKEFDKLYMQTKIPRMTGNFNGLSEIAEYIMEGEKC